MTIPARPSKGFLGLTALLLALASSGSAGAQSAIPTLDELYQRAKPEGQVVFGGAIKEEHVQKIAAAFGARFPGIALKYTRRSTEPMVQLIETERRANRVSFDLLNLTEPGDVVRWSKQNFLARVQIPDTDKMMPDTFEPSGLYTAMSVTPMLGIYSTKQIKREDVPHSLKVLMTDPKWKGAIVISRPIRGGTSSGALMNVANAVGRDVLKSVKDRDILLTLGNEGAIAAVVSGERPISWGVSGYRAIEAKAEGSPIGLIVWDEGLALAQFLGVVPDKAPHPNAGRLLFRWLMTPEGQELLVKNANFYSARTDLTTTPLGEPPLSQLKINSFSNERIVGEGHALAVEFDKAVGL
jgi:iron(III) transport system substrate-binding protein